MLKHALIFLKSNDLCDLVFSFKTRDMGKIRRVRQKLHQSSVKSIDNNLQRDEAVEVTAREEELIGKSPMFKSPEEFAAIPDNVFAGIDINFDSLRKKLTEDDRVSVKSIAKSCKYDSKGKLLTKKEKQKIKHDLWMRSRYLVDTSWVSVRRYGQQ